MAVVKTKKEESLQDDATVQTGWGHQGSAQAKAFSPFSLLAGASSYIVREDLLRF